MYDLRSSSPRAAYHPREKVIYGPSGPFLFDLFPDQEINSWVLAVDLGHVETDDLAVVQIDHPVQRVQHRFCEIV